MRGSLSVGALAALVALAGVALGCAGCGHGEEPTAVREERPPSRPRAARVSRAEQEAGLDQCGALLENLRPTSTPTFATLMRECAGLYAVRECRDVLRAADFSRPAVHEACSRAYCDELRGTRPSFCTRELPSDAEFLTQFAEFSEVVLRRDLRRVMEREGADEIAGLMSQLILDQASR